MYRFNQQHNGSDLVAPEGTEILAPESLIVTGFNSVYIPNTYPDKISNGNFIKAISLDGNREYIFLHLRDVPAVTMGQKLTRGKIIAHVGNTGFSTKAHLHLSVRDVNGKYKNLKAVGQYVSFFDLQKYL